MWNSYCKGRCCGCCGGKKKLKNEDDFAEGGNEGEEEEDWGTWDEIETGRESRRLDSKSNKCGANGDNAKRGVRPAGKAKNTPNINVRRRVKPNYFSDFGLEVSAADVKNPIVREVTHEKRGVGRPVPGANSRFAADSSSAADAVAGWDIDAVSETSGWMQDDVFSNLEAISEGHPK